MFSYKKYTLERPQEELTVQEPGMHINFAARDISLKTLDIEKMRK